MSEILVLVDFDNIEAGELRQGLDYIGRKILRLCDSALSSKVDRVQIRLYGGWYEHGRMTRYGQQLTREIASLGPFRVRRNNGLSLLVNIELATSLLADPATLIDNTYRRREVQRNLKCKRSPWEGCANPADCPCAGFVSFFDTGCSAAGCSVSGSAVMERGEQKVVDSMLVVDLIYASQSGVGVALVSRDDDMWPGLRLAASTGAGLIHLLTRPRVNLPGYYSSLRGGSYTCLAWR